MNKKEYLKRLKQIIKMYHPDLCNNVYLEEIYNEITKKLVNKLNEAKENEKTAGIKKIELNKTSEQDYKFYKSGIKYYKNIHPNFFYKRNSDSTFETKTYNELVSILNKIYLSFNISEYYFNKIIKEYPQSPYFEDSKEKIKLLKRLFKSYDNIVIKENKIIDNEKYIKEMGIKFLSK